jgi:signal transduction histidine kinase
MQDRVPIVVQELIDELAPAAALEAAGRGLQLVVQSELEGAIVHADRQTLAAIVVNLLHNAFKFTRPATTVCLSGITRGDRVLIEIADECGGLPDGDVHELFQPFEQRNLDRTGLGLGLAFSRWGAEMNGGHVSARSP